MATKFVSGKRGKITLDSADINVTGWSANLQDAEIDATNTGSDGWKKVISGIDSGTITFDLLFDVNDPITTKITGMLRGKFVQFVGQIGNTGDARSISGKVKVNTMDVKSTVVGAVTVTCNGVFDDAITYA